MSTNLPLRLLRYLHFFLAGTLIVATVAILVSNVALTVFKVDGHSMDQTLKDGQLIPVYLLCAKNAKPQLGHLVIVRYEGATSVTFVKRVMGTPGDTVPYRGTDYTLKDDEYFVVGDNRDHSTDSREYGPIGKKAIIGFVLGTYGPGPGSL